MNMNKLNNAQRLLIVIGWTLLVVWITLGGCFIGFDAVPLDETGSHHALFVIPWIFSVLGGIVSLIVMIIDAFAD